MLPYSALVLRTIFTSMSLAFAPTGASFRFAPLLPPPRTCSLSYYSADASNRLATLKQLNKQVDARFARFACSLLLSCVVTLRGSPIGVTPSSHLRPKMWAYGGSQVGALIYLPQSSTKHLTNSISRWKFLRSLN
jgi:hypothetical protein